jgi:hypothetical protein
LLYILFLGGLALPTNVPAGDVTSPQHLAVYVFTDRTTNKRAKMEVYTGWVGVHFDGLRQEFASFVLVQPGLIQPYQADDLLDVTVTAAPSSVADDDDEANVAAVDFASVALEPQSFPSVGGTPHCLVLRATVAALNATVHAFTYQVTVLTKGREDIKPEKIGPHDKPR